MTALLHGNGIWLFGEHFTHFCQIAVLRHFVFYLWRIVNKRKLGIFALYYLKNFNNAFVSNVDTNWIVFFHSLFVRIKKTKEINRILICFIALVSYFYLLKTLFSSFYRTNLSDSLQNMTILFLYWIIPNTIFDLITGTI